MAEAARIECRYCGKMCTIKVLKSTHGRTAPRCISIRWEKWMEDNQYRSAGSYTALLAEAGLVKRVPLFVWMRLPTDAEGNEVHYRDPKFCTWTEAHYVSFHAVAPTWAYELAKKLSTDRTLARRLGFTKKRELVTVKPVAKVKALKLDRLVPRDHVVKEWQPCDKDKQLPMHLRVKIMAIAGRNELAREMIFDDPEAAGRIIKDVM